VVAERELAAAFAAAWAAGRNSAVPEGIGPRLVALCAEARSRFPELADVFDDRELATAIARRAPHDAQAYVDRCRGDELALALAAGRGDAAAIATLEHTYRSALDAACRRFVNATDTIEDLRQALRERLFVGPRAKLLEYAGQGLLDSWLRVTAIRLFLDLAKRKDRPRELLARDDEPVLPDPADLGLEIIKLEYRAAVTRAMYEAARVLEPGDRHLLRLSCVTGLSLDQLAVALGVHRATAARRLARAREQLVAGTRDVLRRQLELSPAELDEVVGLVISRLDLSMSKLFASSST